MTEATATVPLIHVAVSRHAAAQPGATALYYQDRRTSYRVLEAAACAYAARLAAEGVRPGEIVPIVLPRSPQLVAVELAVLKCGAAYANLDPGWPSGRHATIIDQISPKVLVTGQTIPSGPYAAIRLGDDDLAKVAETNVGFTQAIVEGSAPATVFFTSGTTGGPKGVVVPHQAVTRMFGRLGLPGFGPGHVTMQSAAIAWDMYGFEVWGQLTAGGCTALLAESYLVPSSLRELIASAGVDTVFLTTSLFNLLVDEDLGCFQGLTDVIVGGEKLSPAHIRSFLLRHPSIPLYNGYGPAENCMLTTTHPLQLRDCDLPGGIPLGTAVPGTTVHVVTEEYEQCAPGQMGEICAGGSGLAVGYLGQPQMTAEKFPTVHIGGKPMRLYRTGDMGFVDEHGVLHFRGRRDRQVKISGHRIELTEIESVARRVPGVRECVVVPLGGSDGQVTGLALCYVTEPGDLNGLSGIDEVSLTAALREQLPSYLVPGVVRRLERFPITANGKIDLQELRLLAAKPRRAVR